MANYRLPLWGLALLLIGLFAWTPGLQADDKPKLELRPGDRIAILGNTLADRMQHFGTFETLLHSRFPRHELVVRNLGFSGDELTLRLRSANFGSPDEHLRFAQADVILAFFGYNESFGGAAGLAKFKQDLAEFIQHTLGEKYNGKTAPRLVLFSPIAHEDLHDRNLPDGKENNARLKLYTAAMAEVARERRVAFVDLFTPSLALYARSDTRLTINGIHLNRTGDEQLAAVIDRALFGGPGEPLRKASQREKLRQAVNDKNFVWFERYRTTDGYSIFGGRADLKFVNDQTNREVMQREMEVLDVMTANRDRRVWAIAQGSEWKLDDGNTPPFIEVITNKPGPLPGGKHVFLGGQESILKMTVGKGMKVNLVASEEMFPELVNPVQMAFDTRGRLWVAAWESYPHWKPKEEMNDKLLILEDTDGDGQADKCITFADHLHNPTGFEFWGGGVFVAMAPDLLFIKDTDGDDRADVRERVLSGLDSADTHHTSNSFTLDPGGALYFQEGTFHHSQVETPYGPPQRVANAGVFRYEPRTQKFDVYVSYGFANPHGHVFDYWGQDIVVDGTGANPYHAALFSGHVDFPAKHKTAPQVYKPRTRPCSSIEYLSSRHFPEDMQGDLLVANVIGFQGILRYKVTDHGASFGASEMEPLLSSSDPSFRPADMEVGPDGALYFTDWHNPIIGHMQHNLRDPSRDRTHGRVYRVTCEGRPLLKPPKIAGEPIEKLLDLLKEPEARVRYRAKIELSGRDSKAVIAAVDRWTQGLDKNDPHYEHHLLETLWVHQHHNEVNPALLERMLASPDFHARAAATRVLCYWRDRVSGTLDLLKRLAADPHPRVRLEAVRAASFLAVPEAVEVPVIAAEQPTDEYLDFVRDETLRTLEPYWKKALASDRPVAFTTDAGTRYWLHNVSNERLLKMKRSRAVCLEMLARPGLLDENRREAVRDLARIDKKTELSVIIETIQSLDQKQDQADASVVFDLVRQLTSRNAAELSSARAELQRLATSARQPILRQIGFVSLINVDQSPEQAWSLATRSVGSLRDFVDAMPLVADASVRAGLYPLVEPLLAGLPKSLSGAGGADEVRRAAMMALTYVRGQEAKTFESLAPFVRDDRERAAAIHALQRIPKIHWPKDQAAPLLEVVVASLSKIPAPQRTSPEALDALEFANALAALLPPAEAKKMRADLQELGVRVVRVGTLFERMAYDQDMIAVRAGRPVEFVFENSDLMPHNFVIVQPGSLEEIGLSAEATAQQPGVAQRHYVPQSAKILLSSTLLQPRATEKLSFNAPSQPGVYPYVCTYPGHWRRMYGALYVVEDLDAYLENPESYLAAHPLEIKDALLKDRRPRTEWKFDDLAAGVGELKAGRSYGNGKQIFQVASCVACHKMDGVGNTFGPDLTKLDPKMLSLDILKELLEPSARINEKYQSYAFELESGKVITGLVLEETADEVKVIENPLAKTDPVELKVSDIAQRQKLATSIMPKGLLEKLSREEILDLVAYVVARGNQQDPLFQGAHGHGAHH
jgi:putative heme-binding domain-containing protein